MNPTYLKFISKKIKICLIIPVYNVEKKRIINVLASIPKFVSAIYVVDDHCPLQTGKFIESKLKKFPKVKVFYNKKNLGVGGAVKVGYDQCLKKKIDIAIKIDGDGQMNPKEIKYLINPILNGVDYVKGNRFLNKKTIPNYPIARLIGNKLLSFISKLSTGYWDIGDPINGFTAISSHALKKISLKNIDNTYFFETDVLHNLYLQNSIVKDVPVTICYFKHGIQNMSILNETINFSFKNLKNFLHRIKYRYFKYSFNFGSLFFLSFLFFFVATIFYVGDNYLNYSIFPSFKKMPIKLMLVAVTFISLIIFFMLDLSNNPNQKKINVHRK